MRFLSKIRNFDRRRSSETNLSFKATVKFLAGEVVDPEDDHALYRGGLAGAPSLNYTARGGYAHRRPSQRTFTLGGHSSGGRALQWH